MCGIFFSINNTSSKQTKISAFIRDAFLTSQVRGMDGTGLAVIGGSTKEQKENPFFFKSVENASAFISNTNVKGAIVRAGNAKLAIGHVRAATHGSVISANAHPFRVVRPDGSSIIGVHNGTLNDWESHKTGKNFTVDSHWALSMIAEHGAEAFAYFDGAYAFVWYDSREPERVFMARNEKRPLYFMVDADEKLILGASEGGMLGWVAERNGFTAAIDEKKHQRLYYLSPGLLYTMKADAIGEWDTEKLPAFDRTKLPLPVRPAMSGFRHYDREYYNNNYHTRYSRSHYDTGWWDNRARYGQAGILSGIKEALREARTSVVVADADSQVIDGEVLDRRLEKGITGAIQQWEQRKDNVIVLPHEVIPRKPFHVRNPNDAAATRGEVVAARKKHVYGQVVQFDPIHYEENDQTLLGEFDVIIDGKTVKAVGELRYDITKARATNLIHGDVPILMSVVGVSSIDVSNAPAADDTDIFVVANLSPSQQESARRHVLH